MRLAGGAPDREGLDFARARVRIGGLAWKTPVVPLDLPGAPPVAMKLESLQRTGSFKVRGAANKLLALTPGERAGGVVAASSGNHGRAVAEVACRLDVPATVCVPDWVDPSKLADIRASAAHVVSAGSSYDEAQERAEGIAAKQGKPFVHPFDDLDVIEGQGTVGLEVMDQFPGVEEVVVPLSGGGLVAGIGYALKDLGVRIVAVSARRAAVMVRSIGYGRPTRFPDERTVASALSGGIGLYNRFTFAACNEVVSSTSPSPNKTSKARFAGPSVNAAWWWRVAELWGSRHCGRVGTGRGEEP